VGSGDYFFFDVLPFSEPLPELLSERFSEPLSVLVSGLFSGDAFASVDLSPDFAGALSLALSFESEEPFLPP
jgi:hypothetical protein